MLHLKVIVIIEVAYLKYLQAFLNPSIEAAKEKYYHNTVNKLKNTQKNSKVYWSLLRIFLNDKKIPIIPLCFTRIIS